MPLAGRNAALQATSVTATSSTNLATTRSTGLGTGPTGYVRINDITKRYLDPSTTHSLYLTAAGSTTLVSGALYEINHVQGKFQWITGDPSTGTYTADVRWLTASAVGGGRSWELDVQKDMFDVTEFGSSGWKEWMPNMTGATATIERFWGDPSFFDAVNLSQRFIVDFILNSASNDKYQAFAYITSNRAGASVDAIVGESIGFTIDGAVYYSSST